MLSVYNTIFLADLSKAESVHLEKKNLPVYVLDFIKCIGILDFRCILIY